MTRLRALYGTTPLHLVAHVAALAFVLWAALQLADARRPLNIALWFVAAVVIHDVLLLPFYAGLDRAARAVVPFRAINHLRVPLGLSALLLLVFFPAILGLNDANFERVAGYDDDGYLGRWLLATAVLFALSAAAYAVRVSRARDR
jgi:hypothetical protein